jgi:hypothetical protein
MTILEKRQVTSGAAAGTFSVLPIESGKTAISSLR